MLDLVEFAKIIESANLGVVGENIFVNDMPSGIEGILIISQNYGNTVDKYLPRYYKDSGFGVIVRNKSFEKGKQIAYNITEALDIMSRVNVGSIIINQCYAKTTPKSYAVSSGNYVEHSIDFHLNYIDAK